MLEFRQREWKRRAASGECPEMIAERCVSLEDRIGTIRWGEYVTHRPLARVWRLSQNPLDGFANLS